MRILYVYYTEFDEQQAHANQIVHTCNALVDQGHEVNVAALGDVKSYARSHEIPLKFEIFRFPLPRIHAKIDQILYYLACFIVAPRFDVIFTRDISFLRVARSVPKLMAPPIIYEAHKVYSHIGMLSSADERSRCRVSDGVVAISDGVADDLSDIDVEVSAIVPDAADVDHLPAPKMEEPRESLCLTTDGQLVVYTGSLSTWKNDLELTLEAFSKVAKDQPGIHLVIVGGGDDLDRLREYAMEEDIDHLVKFTGHVSQSTVFKYLSAADVGVVPLRPSNRIATNYTSPLKLYEYLASNLNVVASDVPSISSATAGIDGVFKYEPGNRDAFARALNQALNAPQPMRDPEDFSYARRAEQLEPILVATSSQS